jgi:murein L,D-transpeptidase YafK
MKLKYVLPFLSLIFATSAVAEVELLISRIGHSLKVIENQTVLEEFYVAFGSGGRFGKIEQGDRKTPYGEYKIMAIKASERFHGFIQLNYPNRDDAAQAYASNIITQEEYDAIMAAHDLGILPPQQTPLGGAIGIHAIGLENKEKIEIHEYFDWTKGCLALRNSEFDILKRYIKKGTTVTIVP